MLLCFLTSLFEGSLGIVNGSKITIRDNLMFLPVSPLTSVSFMLVKE